MCVSYVSNNKPNLFQCEAFLRLIVQKKINMYLGNTSIYFRVQSWQTSNAHK